MRLTGRTPRRALLLSSVGLLLCAGAVPAHGDPVAGPAFTLDQGTRALTMAGGADRAATATATSRPQAAAPAAAPIAEIPGGLECPTGTTRVSTALTEGFEKGSVPEPIDTSHWSVVSGAPAPAATWPAP